MIVLGDGVSDKTKEVSAIKKVELVLDYRHESFSHPFNRMSNKQIIF